MKKKKKKRNQPSFLYRNSLSLVMLFLAVLFLTGQFITGLNEHNEHLQEEGMETLAPAEYFQSGHFLQSTFENWESEFFQMALFVVLTVFLRQQGSSESKPLSESDPVDREPDASKRNAPWPVKRGGFILTVYSHSLSIALTLLFLLSFLVHWYGSWQDYNLEQVMKGEETTGFASYFTSNKLWFESFQNWQSEFLSIGVLVILSIYLREKGSAQSKPVDAANDDME